MSKCCIFYLLRLLFRPHISNKPLILGLAILLVAQNQGWLEIWKS